MSDFLGWQNALVALGVGCAVLAGLWLLLREYRIRYRLAALARERLERDIDPEAGPPASATFADLPQVAQTIADAFTESDWHAYEEALDPSFQSVDRNTELSLGRGRYLKRHRRGRRAFRSVRMTILAAATDDADGEFVWLHLSEHVSPRRGDPFELTWWERWRLDRSREHVLEIRDGGVVSVRDAAPVRGGQPR